MGKYLKLFENNAQYEEARQNLILPNVSYCVNENEVHYNPYVQPFFCKLTLNDDSTVELEGIGELTHAMINAYKSTLVSADIGELCTSIGSDAFYYCSSLKSVTIGNSVTNISGYAFWFCNGLTSITIPDSVSSISDYAFQSCSNLSSVTVKATTPPTLGNLAFNDTNITAIYVPSGSVNTYKESSGWSKYASIIQAIQ